MKKVFSLFTVLAMVSNSAFAAVGNDNIDLHSKMIAKTFNEFRYKMTVEVDPNDPNFQTVAITDFKQKLENLQAQGIAPTEIMDFMRTTTLDEAARADFDRLLTSIDTSQVSAEQAGNLAMNFMAGSYQHGANYSGGQGSYRWAMRVIGVVIVGAVIYCVVKAHITRSTVTPTPTPCDNNNGR